MQRTTLSGVIALGIAGGLAGTAVAETLTSARSAEAPTIDGAMEEAWSTAEPLGIAVDMTPYEPSNGYAGLEKSTVTMRSMHDDERIYFLFMWDDPTHSLERQPWVKQADGSWKQLANKDDSGHENTYYEDKFAMLWDINARGFDKKGCAAACHVADAGMINGIEAGSPGRKFTAREGQTIDMWHWKGVRSAPVGQFDDQFIDSTTDAEANSGWGRKGDSRTGGGYKNNVSDDKSGPAFMPADGSAGAFWLHEADAVPFEDTFAEGDVLPGIIVSPFEGSRGDITAEAVWADGKWTLEFARPLVTTGENADSQDVQFNDLAKEYPFGVAVFDNSQINHVYHEGVMTLRFGG
jgi:hypothetical protein